MWCESSILCEVDEWLSQWEEGFAEESIFSRELIKAAKTIIHANGLLPHLVEGNRNLQTRDGPKIFRTAIHYFFSGGRAVEEEFGGSGSGSAV